MHGIQVQTSNQSQMKKAYVFPGQGSQFPGMAKTLYETNETARAMLDRANEILGFHITKLSEPLKRNLSPRHKNFGICSEPPLVENDIRVSVQRFADSRECIYSMLAG